MPANATPRRLLALSMVLAAAFALHATAVGSANRHPSGRSHGAVASTTTKPGQLVAVALPTRAGSRLVWRVARKYDSGVVKELSEADVGSSVVLVFKVVGRGNTSLVFALTRGDASAKAVKSATRGSTPCRDESDLQPVPMTRRARRPGSVGRRRA